MAYAHPLPVQAAPRPFRRGLAVAALALLAGWTLYTVPPARARAEAALRPWLGAAAEIKFGEARARRETLNGQTVLYVEGSLRNTGARARKSPTLRVTLIGDDGQAVYTWKTKPAKAEIGAAQEATFQTRLAAPPEKFGRIEVSVEG